ncbi:hypothetical protein ACF0H5_019118 [Mactra antiquata]
MDVHKVSLDYEGYLIPGNKRRARRVNKQRLLCSYYEDDAYATKEQSHVEETLKCNYESCIFSIIIDKFDNKMENNTTSHNSSIDLEILYDAGVATHAMNGLLGAGTVLGNSIMVFGIRQMRRTMPDNLIQQLTSLAISDLLAGVAPLLWCFCLIHSVNINTKLCAAINLIYGVAQYATLLNLCLISYRRWKILSSTYLHNLNITFKIPVAFLSITISWTVSLIIHLPLVIGITENASVNGCLSPELWDKPEVIIYIMPLYGMTLLALDVFYIRSFWILSKRRLGLIQPLAQGDSASPPFRGDPSQVRHPADIFNIQPRNSLRALERRRRAHTSERLQARAFKILLIAVLIANFCVIPYVIITMCIANGLIIYMPQQSFMYDMQILALNSFLNPLIYGITVQEVRRSIRCRGCHAST